MNLTEEIQTTLNIEVIPEVSDPTKRWHCFDSGGVEIEVGSFLYGLVRMIKPMKILETGLYSAISTMYMAQALKENGFGHIDSIELEDAHVNRSKERLVKMGLLDLITIYHQSSLDFTTQSMYDIIFLDTEPHLRFEELLRFEENLNDGGIIMIHDLGGGLCQVDNKELGFGWPFGRLPDKIVELVEKDSLRPFHFATPRGLTCFYRPRRDDFRFYRRLWEAFE